MSYIGVNPQRNLRRFTSTKPEDSYPEQAKNDIKLLSFSRNKLATPFGSYIYRIQKYPGDLDLVEEFTECCDVESVVTQFEKALKKTVKEINKKRLHYFSEVKAGLDNRYDVDIGEMENGTYFPSPQLAEITHQLHKENLLSDEDHDIIQFILSKKEVLGANEYDTIFYIFREHRILRWTDKEILDGKKILPGNRVMKLKDALTYKSPVKIDMIAEENGKLVEVTNFLQLAYEQEGEIYNVNINLEEDHDIPTQLPQEIEKLYFSDMFYSPFKMIKRMYSLARHNQDVELLNKVIPFVSSNTSMLYQIKSEIDTIILIIEKMKSFPKKLIFNQLDNAKIRLATVLELSDDDLETINNLIDDINLEENKKEKIPLLKNLKKYIVAHINLQTISYLQKVGLNPPPNQYLPPRHTYDINHVRGIAENPENPYKKYLHIVENMQSSGQGGYNVYYPTENHYPNFLQDPESIRKLSERIINNPGFHQQLNQEQLNFERSNREPAPAELYPPISGAGSRQGAWWSAYLRRYRKDNKENPFINYPQFVAITEGISKYDYNKINKKIYDSIDFLEDEKQIKPRGYEINEEFDFDTKPVKQSSKYEFLEEELRKCGIRTDNLINIVGRNGNIPQPSYSIPIQSHIPQPPPPPPLPVASLTPEEREEMVKRREQGKKKVESMVRIKSPQEAMLEELRNKIPPKAEGICGGYGNDYANGYRMPLYMSQNLPTYGIMQNEMHLHPQTASSYASDYYGRGYGYGPSLKPPHINYAPLVVNGELVYSINAGCNDCGLENFRGKKNKI